MAEQAYAYVTLIPVAKGFQSAIAKEMGGAGNIGAKAGREAGDRFASALKVGVAGAAIVAGAAVAGIGTAITKGFGRLQSIEEARTLLIGTGNTAADVEQAMADALASVKGTAFGLGDAARVAAGAVAAGIRPGEQLAYVLGNVADVAAVAGVPIAEIGAIFNKVTTANKAYNGELQQLSERGIPIYQYLAKELGVTGEAIQEMASDGEITAELFNSAIANNISGAALKMGETTAGAFANTGAAIGRVGANLIGPIYARFAEFFNAVIEGLGPLEEIAKSIGESFGVFLNPQIDKLVALASNLSVPVQMAAQFFGILRDNVGGVVGYFAPLISSFANIAGLLPALVPIIGSVADLFTRLALEGLDILIPLASQFMTDVVPMLIAAIIELAPVVLEIVSTIADAFIPVLAELSTVAVPVLIAILSVVIPVIQTLATIVSNTSVPLATMAVIIFGVVKAVAIFKAGLLLLQAVQLGVAAASYGAAGATYAQGTAANVARIATMLFNGQLFLQAGALITNVTHLIASKAALVGTTVATNAAALAQRALNFAMSMNPIGFLIAGLAVLTTGIIYLATNTQFFQTIWEGLVWFFQRSIELSVANLQMLGEWFAKVWDGIVSVFDARVSYMGEQFQAFAQFLSMVWDGVQTAFITVITFIGDAFKSYINGWISLFEGFVNGVISGVNSLIRALNRISFSLPSWVPGIGGKSFGINLSEISNINLPRLAEGGYVDSPTTAIIGEAGPEVVMPLDRFEKVVGIGGENNQRAINYYAAPNKSFDAEQELLLAMRRVKVMA